MKLIKTRKTGSYHFVGFVRVSSFAAVEHFDNKRTEEEEISVDLVEGKRTVSVVALHQEKKKKGLARDERENCQHQHIKRGSYVDDGWGMFYYSAPVLLALNVALLTIR